METTKKIAGIIATIITLALAVIELIKLIKTGETTEANPLKLAVIMIIGTTITAFCFAPTEYAIAISLCAMGIILMCHEIYIGRICWTVEEAMWADISNTSFGWIRIITGVIGGGLLIWCGGYVTIKSLPSLSHEDFISAIEKDKLFLTFFFILGGAKINQYTSYYTDYEHVGWGEYVPSTKYKTPIEFAKSDSMRNLLKIFGAKSRYLN